MTSSRQALAKWPNVPHCYGWLGLDARGNWFLRDDRTQALGPFSQAKGSQLRHDKLIDFIQRNYEHDDAGPVVLPERAPAGLRRARGRALDLAGRRRTCRSARIPGCRSSPRPACSTAKAGSTWWRDIGLGLVHTQDVGLAAEAIEQGRWVPEDVRAEDLPARFGHVLSPAAASRPARRTRSR